ncbi:MAG: polymer-forming cytoskeletal protein [Lachnospiraceae bacterium]|nr:polymer-forming cytoskeletal protein [Lachnospiraceae bacterium]
MGFLKDLKKDLEKEDKLWEEDSASVDELLAENGLDDFLEEDVNSDNITTTNHDEEDKEMENFDELLANETGDEIADALLDDANVDMDMLAQMLEDDSEAVEEDSNAVTEEEALASVEVEEEAADTTEEAAEENLTVETQEEVEVDNRVPSDNVTVITKGTKIDGSISSDGSLEVNGTITGDVDCLGKLTIVGTVSGNSTAAEIYVNTARLVGNLTSKGSVKIGVGTIVVGDIKATSGVIAGAVKGQIDIDGPVIVDSTAIVKGNINAKSVQINNGAVVDGYCSLTYASVDIDNFFEGE